MTNDDQPTIPESLQPFFGEFHARWQLLRTDEERRLFLKTLLEELRDRYVEDPETIAAIGSAVERLKRL